MDAGSYVALQLQAPERKCIRGADVLVHTWRLRTSMHGTKVGDPKSSLRSFVRNQRSMR